jgi:hypothetical protein
MGIVSLVSSTLSLFLLGSAFFLPIFMHGERISEGGATILGLSVLGSNLLGIGAGFISRDAARKRSALGLVGIIIGFLVLSVYVLLIVFGMRNKG